MRAIPPYSFIHSFTIQSASFGHLIYIIYRGRTLNSRMNQSRFLTQSAQSHVEQTDPRIAQRRKELRQYLHKDRVLLELEVE